MEDSLVSLLEAIVELDKFPTLRSAVLVKNKMRKNVDDEGWSGCFLLCVGGKS